MNNIDSLLKGALCSIHHGDPNYIPIDPKSFQVFCTLCSKEGFKSRKKNLIIVGSEHSNVEKSSSQKNPNSRK